jgi:hypothetical protein
VMGFAKTSLMLGVYAAATNLRLLRTWTARQNPRATDELPTSTSTPGRTAKRRAAAMPKRGISPPS